MLQPIVRKDMKLEWPRAETATHWIAMGFDEDLDEAMKIATRETVNMLVGQKAVPLSRDEAYALTSMVGDCRVTQVVDIRKGVHCMVPKKFRQEVACCGQARAATLPVAATTTDVADLVAAVGGDRVRVESLTDPRHDPHTRELLPRQLGLLKEAALVVRIGLDHEPWLRRAVAAARARGRDLDLSRAVAVLDADTPRLRAGGGRICTPTATPTTGSIRRTRGRSPRALPRRSASFSRRAPRCSRPTARDSSPASTPA